MSFDPYAVLGVPRDASFEVLRGAYRRLVREYHPDVAHDKTAATVRMAQINQAWRLVGDGEKRANFDAAWRLEQIELEHQRQASARAARRSARPDILPSQRHGSGAARGKAGERKSIRGREGKSPHSTRDLRLMHQVLVASQLFHNEKKTKEAVALCRQVLLADGRNVAARELMGDIFAHQGHFQYALMMFDQAIQIAPEDLMLRRKRDLLERAQSEAQKPRDKKTPRSSLWGRLRAKLSRG